MSHDDVHSFFAFDLGARDWLVRSYPPRWIVFGGLHLPDVYGAIWTVQQQLRALGLRQVADGYSAYDRRVRSVIAIPRQTGKRSSAFGPTLTGKRSSSWSPSQLGRYTRDVKRVIAEFVGAIDEAMKRLDDEDK